MNDLRTAAQQALEALEFDGFTPEDATHRQYTTKAITALRAALAQQAEPQDAELSAALGWPGGISDPILDRKTLLRQVADLRAALASSCDEQRHQLWESGGFAGCERARVAERQRDALLEALKKAEENGCATVYSNDDDECGVKGCCGVVSYKPHADDCWVAAARAAIKAVEENT